MRKLVFLVFTYSSIKSHQNDTFLLTIRVKQYFAKMEKNEKLCYK